MDRKERFDLLWRGYLSDLLSEEEVIELLDLINSGDGLKEEHIDRVFQLDGNQRAESAEGDLIFRQILVQIQDERPSSKLSRTRVIWYWSAAACVIIILGLILFDNKSGTRFVHTDIVKQEIQPGTDGAILTLADNSKILLDTAKDGVIALQGGVIARIEKGSLIYEKNGTLALNNTMSTPRGRQFNLVLPDGTKVWLNAASSITYSTVFTGKDRTVKVTGEAFFEVAPDQSHPFYVKLPNDVTVEVLGTQFNVNAYDNEPSLKTTLLQGAVKVKQQNLLSGLEQLVLKPGEQGIIDHRSNNIIKLVHNVDIGNVVAWKNGLFNFNGADIKMVMQQLERWYDIDVQYQGNGPDLIFKGEMYRSANLEDVLDGLSQMGVKFKIKERTVIVL